MPPDELNPGIKPPPSTTGGRILVVEDDPSLRELLATEVAEAGHHTTAVDSAEAARAELSRELPDLVITDIRLPGADGMQLLGSVQKLDHPPAVIVITAFGSVPQAVAAMRQGAVDFLTKPLDLDHLHLAINRALHLRNLEQEVDRLHGLLDNAQLPGLVGNSRPMQRLREHMQLIAGSDAPVLISGESGAGKELVARGLARLSPRAGQAFVAVNCASVPEQLLESEFFGHRAGAFTGAEQHRQGLFSQASGGTLMLDEIGEMPLAMQAKLLRVLQDKQVRPLGAETEYPVDVRIIAATNKNLADEVAAGRFREDLYYRLETFSIDVPPLRDRGEDIDLLAVHFLRLSAHQLGKVIHSMNPDALSALRNYPFPGNVRELRNIMERAATFCPNGTLEVSHLPPRVRSSANAATPAPSGDGDGPLGALLDDGMLPTLDEIQQRYVAYVLERVNGNKRRAAALLGIGRRTLYRWLDESDSSSGG